MKEKIKKAATIFFTSPIVYVLVLGLLLRLILSTFGTLNLDQGTFIAWSRILVQGGFRNFYNSWSDYLPGYLYVLWLLGKINLLGAIPQTVLYKLPAIFSDLTVGYLIYKIIKKAKDKKWGLIAASLWLFNPAVFGNSALWGQVDSLTALTSIFSVYILPSNIFLSALSLGFGTLIKPQTAFIFPAILFLFIKNKKKVSDYLLYAATGLIVFTASFIPFWNHGNLIQFIFERLSVSFSQYPYTSINAFNFWSLGGFWKPDNIYFEVGGYLLVLISSIILCFKLWKKNLAEYYIISFIFAGSFMFFTRIHERHLLPVFAPLTIAAIDNPFLIGPLVIFSITYILNLYYSFIWITNNFKQVFSNFFLKLLAFLNVGSAVALFYSMVQKLNITWKKVIAFVKEKTKSDGGKVVYKMPKINFSKGRAKIILYAILAFAFLTRVYDLGSPTTMYFDEVYHAFTAKVILSADPAKAWEWWNTPPAGFAYEWTHPPLAKLGMALGMIIFGQNSFGWRIPGAILGVGSVLLVYLLAKEFFDDEAVALLSAGAFSLDGLTLVMSRIGMNDSYLLFFTLLSLFLFMRKKDFLSAVSFGLALASKWSAVWAIPILGILWLQRNPLKEPPLKVIKTFLWFLLLPSIIYLLSYFQMFSTGHGIDIWWGMQEQMWWYHTGLKATHPYSSPWWSWPFLIRPIYLYTSDEIGGMVSRIYAFGNPLVFWFGLSSIIISLFYSYIEKNKKLAIVVFSYFIFFVPWAFSPRIMFLYHYLPSIPFMAIAIGYVLRRNYKLVIPFFVMTALLFFYFFPHYIGMQIPLWLDKSYYWVSSWR